MPKKLLFYCNESRGEGGETLFANTEEIWKGLTRSEQQTCERLSLRYKTQKVAHYGGEIEVPLVQRHPDSGEIILRIAESVMTSLNPVSLEVLGMEDGADFVQELSKKLYEKRYLYEHTWEKGDVLVCDNYTYLHGRRALGTNISRSFKRVQIL